MIERILQVLSSTLKKSAIEKLKFKVRLSILWFGLSKIKIQNQQIWSDTII